MKARHFQHILQFRFPAGTSRGVLHQKPTSYLVLEQNGSVGIGECSTIPGLNIDPEDTYYSKLDEVCRILNEGLSPDSIDLHAYPSILFGLETALLDLKAKGSKLLFPSEFSTGKIGIPINGLVWMGDKAFMQQQIGEKIKADYHCIKLKVGALDFETEIEIIQNIRREFSAAEIEIRLDANGGFLPKEALQKLERLSAFQIHSIEQPIRQGQLEAMAQLCSKSPIPIVLDEELIGVQSIDKEQFIKQIKPAYIILKPSLLGGFGQSEEWITFAEKHHVKWWITSALESNIGLNAIAQWTFTLNSALPQGLGTGQLYHNNVQSPLEIREAELFYNTEKKWEIEKLIK
jgi:o-succinylbenzoate synthase